MLCECSVYTRAVTNEREICNNSKKSLIEANSDRYRLKELQYVLKRIISNIEYQIPVNNEQQTKLQHYYHIAH